MENLKELAVTVHGRATVIDVGRSEHVGFRETLLSIYVPRYGEQWETFLDSGPVYARVDDYGFTSAASRNPDRLAGTVAISVPDAPLVSRTLKARDFVVDYRPPVGVRISPHFYNTMDEIDRVMAEIASITATKDYADGGTSSLVT